MKNKRIANRHGSCPTCHRTQWKTIVKAEKDRGTRIVACRHCGHSNVQEYSRLYNGVAAPRISRRSVLKRAISFTQDLFNGPEKTDNLKRRGAIINKVSKTIYRKNLQIQHFGNFRPISALNF